MAGCRTVHGRLGVETGPGLSILDVTGRVEEWLARVGARSGILTIWVPHTTAALAVNEAESGLLQDILELLRELTRPGAPWKHNRIDNNAHAHLGNVLVGPGWTVPVEGGRMILGTWQRILFVEMDGPRRRRLVLTFVGETGE